MNHFCLIMAYYENGGMLQEHLNQWDKLPRGLKEHIHVRIVDDGSPTKPAAEEIIDESGIFGLGSFQLWRMGVDIRWNQDACRNVGVREAPTQWILLTDMDHVVPLETWQFLIRMKLNKHQAYRFARVNAPNGEPYKPHPNSYAMTRSIYWEAGGYDEALAGNYGTDGDFLVRLQRVCPVEYLEQPLVRYPREVIPDASTTTLTRKSEVDKETIKRLVKEREKFGRKPRHFTFPCARVI